MELPLTSGANRNHPKVAARNISDPEVEWAREERVATLARHGDAGGTREGRAIRCSASGRHRIRSCVFLYALSDLDLSRCQCFGFYAEAS
jgi:hypothetical protein